MSQDKKLLISRNATLYPNKDGPPIYLLNLNLKTEDRDIRKMEFGRPSGYKPEQIIMLLGATGSGKTTLINSMINHILGVEWTDDFRVRLIPEEALAGNQTRSQTLIITSYTIHHQPWFKVSYTLTIIDTPGFGDTAGISRDKDITKMIDRFFRNHHSGLDQITAVGLVVQSSLARLTVSQRYVFDSILSLFGKDIADNIIPLLTFADGQQPQVLSAFTAAEIPFKKYFKFNNSVLFVDNSEDNQFDHMFWKLRTKSFNDFFLSVETMPNQSLSLTKELLSERETLQLEIEKINQGVDTGISELNRLDQELDMMKRHELDIENNKNFTYTVDVEKVTLENVPKGTFTTNCLPCKRTCHASCAFENDDEKKKCSSMSNGYCTVCPGKCSWREHKNLPHRYIITIERQTKKSEDIMERYQIAKGEKMTQGRVMKGLMRDFEKTREGVILKSLEARRCINRIKEIALKPNPLSTEEYVNLLIEGEKIEKEEGFLQRIKQLNEVKKATLALDQLTLEGFDPFKDYSETIKKVKERSVTTNMDRNKECCVM